MSKTLKKKISKTPTKQYQTESRGQNKTQINAILQLYEENESISSNPNHSKSSKPQSSCSIIHKSKKNEMKEIYKQNHSIPNKPNHKQKTNAIMSE